MKYLVKFFVVTIFVLFCTHAFAEQKIVVMNLKEVLNSMSLYLGMEIPNWPPENIAELSKKLEENN